MKVTRRDVSSGHFYHYDYHEPAWRLMMEARCRRPESYARDPWAEEQSPGEHTGRWPGSTGSDVLLLLSEEHLRYFVGQQPQQGMLIVSDDDARLEQREVMPSRDPTYQMWGTGRTVGYETPAFWITEEVANRLLAGTEQTVQSLRHTEETLGQDEVAVLPTGLDVSLEITGTAREKMPVRHVIGHLPGTRGHIEGGPAAAQMDDQLIMVLAQYDGVGNDASIAYPAANDNASGVAVMLEAIRTLQEQEYAPYRTFLFVAYAGEGSPHGLAHGRQMEVTGFLQAKRGFASAYKLQAVIYLRGLGQGTEPTLELSAGSSQRLIRVFEDAARRMRVRTQRGAERLDMNLVFDEGSAFDSADEAPNITLRTVGWDETSHRPADTLQSVSTERLEEAGEALALALMVMGREEY